MSKGFYEILRIIIQWGIDNNTKSNENDTPVICSYRKSNINTSVQCVEMVKIQKQLQTSNIKAFEKSITKIIKNPRENEFFTS